jgi:hypothetical protein
MIVGAVVGGHVGGLHGAAAGSVVLGLYGLVSGKPFEPGGGPSRRARRRRDVDPELEREIEDELARAGTLEEEIDEEISRQEEHIAATSVKEGTDGSTREENGGASPTELHENVIFLP